jgi:hypothetical protein
MIFVMSDNKTMHYFRTGCYANSCTSRQSEFAEKVTSFLDRSLDVREERNFEDGDIGFSHW